MKNGYLVLFFLFSFTNIIIFTSSSLAVEDADVLYPTIGKEVSRIPMPPEKKTEKFKMDFSASVIGGYTSNVYLDHYDLTSSAFIQETFNARGRYEFTDFCTLRGEYDMASIKYTRESEWDLLDNIGRVGLDTKIADSLLLSADYIIDFVRFPHYKASNYTMNELETGLRHDITDWLYHKLLYRFSYKHYPKWKNRNRDGITLSEDREDKGNAIEHQLGTYLIDKTFIRLDNAIYFNNSNYVYLDYYDYTAVKTKVTAMQLITDKLHGAANFGYQYKAYENRNVSDGDDNERNHLLMGGVSLFYDITPEISIGANFDFRKNLSNEGNRKYTDYIISSGLYAKF